MSVFKILIIILVLIYIFSPVDLLPDIFPITGWLDDALMLGGLIYYLKRGSLAGILSWLKGSTKAEQSRQQRFYQQESGAGSKAGAQTQDSDPYEILGLKPGASPEEIRSAYLRAVQTYHPDKVSHLGAEFQELAKKKFVAIQSAYEKLLGKNTG